jgi:glycosyltransferase involved in cell wall biosynthesis
VPPLVSILIPCYNAEPWLSRTIESALAQTWPNCEIIVVDDGSRDGSLALARTFEANGVRVLTQPNRGAASARNAALRAARGQFIQHLDADDLLSPDKIAAQVRLLEAAGGRAAASCRWGRFTDDPAHVAFVDEAVFRNLSPIEFLLLHTREGRMMHPAAWLVPRTLAERAGPWDERLTLNDDGEYFARVVLAADRIVFSPAGASLYRSNVANSLACRRSPPALESLALSVELVSSHLQRVEDSPRIRQALADYWQRLVYELYPEAPDLLGAAEQRVKELGGSELLPQAGVCERLAARFLGWKLARRLRRTFS